MNCWKAKFTCDITRNIDIITTICYDNNGDFMFYVYRWYNLENDFTFYVGKGCKDRYKTVRGRNRLFMSYYSNNNCSVEILKYFDREDDALAYEHKMIIQYKNKGECTCNVSDGGYGGLSFVWTKDMRDYKSKYNPMKSSTQRDRMSKFNPMKNSDIAKVVGFKHRKFPVINDIEYNSVEEAASKYNVTKVTIQRWCKRGYSTDYLPCYYKGENQVAFTVHTTSSRGVIVDDMYFLSVRDASKYLNTYPEKIIRAIKAGKDVFGHICKYANQQPSAGLNDL